MIFAFLYENLCFVYGINVDNVNYFEKDINVY